MRDRFSRAYGMPFGAWPGSIKIPEEARLPQPVMQNATYLREECVGVSDIQSCA
jgi:hypothetical protein